MTRDRMQQLRASVRLQPTRLLLDKAQAEMDVAEELSLVGGEKERTAIELPRAAHVVEQSGREQQVAAQARVDLGRFTT
jgi:hypothetical protein